MEILTIHPKNKAQSKAIKAGLKAKEIPFESKKENNYNPEFVEKLKLAKKRKITGKQKPSIQMICGNNLDRSSHR